VCVCVCVCVFHKDPASCVGHIDSFVGDIDSFVGDIDSCVGDIDFLDSFDLFSLRLIKSSFLSLHEQNAV
jgi:hypothetical protein